MKHLNKLLLFFFLSPLFSAAQANYKPGYIVTLKGDTLNGLIDYKEWDKTPKNISFKNSVNAGKTESLSTADISAFEVRGVEYYKRFILPISQDQVEISKMGKALDTTSTIDTVFLRVLTSGKNLMLYSYTDDIKSRFYLLEAGQQQPQELVYHAYYSPDESTSVHYVNTYRGQLEYFADKYGIKTPKLDQQILRTNYIEPQLIKIVQIINGPSAKQFTEQNLAGSRFFAGVSLNYSSIKYEEVPGTSLEKINIINSSSIFPKINAGIDLFTNKSVQQLSIRLELSFTVNKYNISGSNPQSTPASTTTLNFTQYNSSLMPQINYNFYNAEKLKVFAGAGLSFNLSAYNKYQYITKYGDSFPDINIQNNYPDFSKFWISIPLRIGVTMNSKLEVSVCYQPSSSLTKDNIGSANVTSYQAGISYLFGGK